LWITGYQISVIRYQEARNSNLRSAIRERETGDTSVGKRTYAEFTEDAEFAEKKNPG